MNSPHIQPATPALAKPERRLHPRYSVQVQIEIHQEATRLPMRCVTADLSRGGCYVQLVTQFPLGVHVRATLWLDGRPIVIRGLIVTRHPQFGNGIMFLEFEGDAEQLLTRYLKAIPAA